MKTIPGIPPVSTSERSKTARDTIKSGLGVPVVEDKYTSAFNNKNPLSLGSWEEAGTAVDGKVKRLHENETFKKLDSARQEKVLGRLYDMYVPSSYQKFGKNAPDKAQWVSGVQREYSTGYVKEQLGDLVHGFRQAANNISLYGSQITKQNFLHSYGLGSIFGVPVIGTWDLTRNTDKAAADATDSVFNKWARSAQNNIHEEDYYFASNPRSGFWGGAGKWTGEQLAMLPIYAELGGIGGAVGKGLLAETGLTDTLAGTTGGKAIVHAVRGGFFGLMGSMIEHGRAVPTKEDVKKGLEYSAGEVAGGWLFEKAGEWFNAVKGYKAGQLLKVANDAAIKQWSAEQLAQGGDPLVQATTHAASEELRASVEPSSTGVEAPPRAEGPQAPTPTTAVSTTRMDPETRATRDPVTHALIEGDKAVLQSISVREFGRPFELLKRAEQERVVTMRLQKMEETKFEMPARKPELNKQEVAKDIAEQTKASPTLSKRAQQYKEMFGEDISEAVSEHQSETNAKQSGIKNADAAAQKIAPNKSVSERLGPKPPKEEVVTPEMLKAHRKDMVEHFNAPIRSVGADLYLKDMKTEDFINYLKEGDKNLIKFEDPFHRMLFHWGNKRQLPDAVRTKLLSELKAHVKDAYPRQAFLAADLDKYAERGGLHLQMLAQSGRLSTERNMFRSTNLFGAPTEWQTDLNTEIDQEEISRLKSTIMLHKSSLGTVNTYLKALQSNRARGLVTPRQWRDYNEAIGMLLGGELKKARTYGRTLEEVYATVPK